MPKLSSAKLISMQRTEIYQRKM